MNHSEEAIKTESGLESDLLDKSGSIKTLVAAVFTGLVFWGSLFALLFFCLTS